VTQQERLREATDISTLSPKHRASFTFDISRRGAEGGASLGGDRTFADRLDASVVLDTHHNLRSGIHRHASV
jgi:hypothetical protein